MSPYRFSTLNAILTPSKSKYTQCKYPLSEGFTLNFNAVYLKLLIILLALKDVIPRYMLCQFMQKSRYQGTIFTQSVKSLSARIFGKNTEEDSMVERAISYFNQPVINAPTLETISTKTERSSVKNSKELALREAERESRCLQLEELCKDIIALSEGETFEEDNRKSSQLLSTIALLIPREQKKVYIANELNKPLYKAILCLRLLDRLCLDNVLIDPYVKERLGDISPKEYTSFALINPEGYQRFINEVKIPVVKAALLQDIGNNHPEAQKILKGIDGKENPFRMLEVNDRRNLLQINYRETITYLIDGIGALKYSGNNKEESALFEQTEKRKLLFIKNLIKGSIKPKKGIGNLLKVPQIYSSIILSTKPNYNYGLLPKVYQVLDLNAEKGMCDKTVVHALKTVTGIFPLGYGVTYITVNISGDKQFCYEYAIVKELYPDDAEAPICRTTTRNLVFITFGQDIIIPKNRNLHYPDVVKKLDTISKERLNEILKLLASNYIERKEHDLIPRYWFANEYFLLKANQKLWNK